MKAKIIHRTRLASQKGDAKQSMKHYWPIRSDNNNNNNNTFSIAETITEVVLQQLPVKELVYWVNMNANIENTIIWCETCLEYQQT